MSTQRANRICLSTMVANESKVILRMLESCYQYIDYWIIQDNGSTDGTQDIITNFLNEKGIPGFLYEINWKYPGWNRDHLIQMCLNTEHGCDWILRMDADEQLSVDSDFDWGLLTDTSIQSFNVIADAGDTLYYRTWLWNSKIPWRFKHDKRHEIITLPGSGNDDEDFQRINLPKSFRHIIRNDGQTWNSPTKFLKDALELESDLVVEGKALQDPYHLFYLAKSYYDCYGDSSKFPFGVSHSHEYARRSLFYFEEYLELSNGWKNKKSGHSENEMSYFSLCLIANLYKYLGEHEKAILHYNLAEQFCPNRNEHLMWLAELFQSKGEFDRMLDVTSKLISQYRKNPFPERCFLILNHAYPDTGTYVSELHRIAEGKIQNTPGILESAEGPSIKK